MEFIQVNEKKRKKTCSLLRRTKRRGRRHGIYSGEQKEEAEEMVFTQENKKKRKKTCSLPR